MLLSVRLSVCLCTPSSIFSFSMRSVWYQRKVGDYFFPELLVILLSHLRLGLPSSLFPFERNALFTNVENNVCRNIVGPMEQFRTLHNKEHSGLCRSPSIVRVVETGRPMIWAHGWDMRGKKYKENFGKPRTDEVGGTLHLTHIFPLPLENHGHVYTHIFLFHLMTSEITCLVMT
jgi:hypothetical protein